MRKILALLFAAIMGFLFNPSAYSQGVLEQLASESWIDSSSGEGAKLKDKEVSFEAHRPFNAILERVGFGEVNILISKQETDYQEKAMKGGMPFKSALEKAFESIMIDDRQKDSLYQFALGKAYKKLKIEPQYPAPKIAVKETVEILKTNINSGESEIKILGLSKIADRGESAKSNWVFYLHVPEISPKGFFIIVDRSGKNAVYNYQAIISYHNSDMSGEINDAPEIPVVEGGINPKDIFSSKGKGQDIVVESFINELRRQGKVLYENYGGQLTMARVESWPGNMPLYGEFAEPYRNYLDKVVKIDGLRIEIRRSWIKLNENLTNEEALSILSGMKKMGREYDSLVGECIKYIRQGQSLYAEGKATFPSLLYNIKLVKDSQRIQLYDDEGKKIQRKVCTHWKYNNLNYFPFGGFYTVATGAVYVCDKWKMVDVKAKIPDYRLEHSYNGDQVYPHRARMIDVPPTPAFPEVFIQESVKRDQYDMEVTVTCALDKDSSKGWLITKARLRKGKASSSDALGGSIGASGKIGVPLVAEGGISVNVNYGHTWGHFRFGEMVEFPEFVGTSCFELGRGRIMRKNHEEK
ncbi:MAG: hypothetical protein L6420_00835 [Elusimicrobia bacterium]|nr:hypothetical protein [Elusimicrobiota bacterium]